MTDCCNCEPASVADAAYRRILWIVLVLNAIMFCIESVAGYVAGSSALQADAVDFLGDALNYVSALYVLNRSAHWKSGAATVKAIVIGVFGIFVLGNALYHWLYSALPEAKTMGAIGLLALFINLICASLLFRFRQGDSNRSAVWICSRNDAIANLLVIGAGIVVYFTSSKLPDLVVSVIIAGLALSGAKQIMQKAKQERQVHSDSMGPK